MNALHKQETCGYCINPNGGDKPKFGKIDAWINNYCIDPNGGDKPEFGKIDA